MSCPALLSACDFEMTLTRDFFDELCAPVFARVIPHVKDTLEKAKLTKEQIDVVLPVGGSSRIHKIQELLNGYFG